jgi:hypothetical protein
MLLLGFALPLSSLLLSRKNSILFSSFCCCYLSTQQLEEISQVITDIDRVTAAHPYSIPSIFHLFPSVTPAFPLHSNFAHTKSLVWTREEEVPIPSIPMTVSREGTGRRIGSSIQIPGYPTPCPPGYRLEVPFLPFHTARNH